MSSDGGTTTPDYLVSVLDDHDNLLVDAIPDTLEDYSSSSGGSGIFFDENDYVHGDSFEQALEDVFIGDDGEIPASLFNPMTGLKASRTRRATFPDDHQESMSKHVHAFIREMTEISESQSVGSDAPGGAAASEPDESEEHSFSMEESTACDFAAFPFLPTSFLELPAIPETIPECEAQAYAKEHRMLLKALLQLLTERDHIGVEGDVNDSFNILKQGPLKKSSLSSVGRPTWKVKYVELRKGNFTYYQDDDRGSRKTIHLRQDTSSCEEASEQSSKGFVFSIRQEGGPTRYWMANSYEERQAWIRSINAAMKMEETVPLDLKPHIAASKLYQTLQSQLRQARFKATYMASMRSLMYPKALRVPVRWVRENQESQEATQAKQKDRDENTTKPYHQPAQKRLKTSIADFWRNMSQHSVSVNGHLVPKRSSHGPERIIGALSRCILEFDKAASSSPDDPTSSAWVPSAITELQAISYARNILMSVMQGIFRDDAHCSIDHLCQNSSLVVVLPYTSSEVIHIDVSFAGEPYDEEPGTLGAEMSGWVSMRNKNYHSWKNRFCVVSEGVLSYYEHASPRPHGLRGQLVLGGATISESGEEEDARLLLQIATKDQERQFSFANQEEFSAWKDAVTRSTVLLPVMPDLGERSSTSSPNGTPTRKKGRLRVNSTGQPGKLRAIRDGGAKVIKGTVHPCAKLIKQATPRMIKGATTEGVKVIKGATGGVIKGAKDGSRKVIKGASDLMLRKVLGGGQQPPPSPIISPEVGRSVKSPYAPVSPVSNQEDEKPRREDPTVQVLVQASSVYRIVTADPSGDDEKDTWTTVRAKLLQAFLLSGGNSGRLTRGDELVELEFQEGMAAPDSDFVQENSENSLLAL